MKCYSTRINEKGRLELLCPFGHRTHVRGFRQSADWYCQECAATKRSWRWREMGHLAMPRGDDWVCFLWFGFAVSPSEEFARVSVEGALQHGSVWAAHVVLHGLSGAGFTSWPGGLRECLLPGQVPS